MFIELEVSQFQTSGSVFNFGDGLGRHDSVTLSERAKHPNRIYVNGAIDILVFRCLALLQLAMPLGTGTPLPACGSESLGSQIPTVDVALVVARPRLTSPYAPSSAGRLELVSPTTDNKIRCQSPSPERHRECQLMKTSKSNNAPDE